MMECMEVVKSNQENEVVEEVRKGYTLGEKVLRVAQVKVGKRDIDQQVEELAKEELQKGDYIWWKLKCQKSQPKADQPLAEKLKNAI